MRICDLPLEEIKIGMRVQSIDNPALCGTISQTEQREEWPIFWITWDGKSKSKSAFFYNECKCEIVEK